MHTVLIMALILAVRQRLTEGVHILSRREGRADWPAERNAWPGRKAQRRSSLISLQKDPPLLRQGAAQNNFMPPA